MTTSSQEARWVLRAQCDDREALELLLRSVEASVHRYVAGIVGATHADDVVQDVLIIVCRKLSWLAAPELFRPWVFRIASRAAFRHLKREKRWNERAADVAALDALPAPDARPSDDALTDLLRSDAVSPASRAVLSLHFQEEMPLAEVAAVLEIPLGTVKSRLAFGLKALRKHLADGRSL